jgi:hypothetical protein
MWKDPIVEEVRKNREEYASRFNFDAHAIFEDISKRQRERGEKLLKFPPRKPKPKQNAA